MSHNHQASQFTTIMNTPMVFSPHQPPFVPQLATCPSYLFPYVAPICSAVATMVGQNVQANPHPGRILTFNILSANGYQNNEFAQAVATAVDYIALHMHKGVYQNIEQAIQDSIPRVLAIVTSLNIVNNPQMHYMLDANITNEARRVAQHEFAQLQHEVLNFKMNTSAHQHMGQHMGMGQGYHHQPNQHHHPQGMAMMPNNIHQRHQHMGHQPPRQHAGITSAGFGSAAPNNAVAPMVKLPQSHRYDRDRQPTRPPPPPAAPPPAAPSPWPGLHYEEPPPILGATIMDEGVPPQDQERFTKEPRKIARWVRSRKQPFLPTYRPSKEEPYAYDDVDLVDSFDIMIVKIDEIPKEDLMNREQHTLYSANKPPQYATAEQALEVEVTQHAQNLKSVKVDPLNTELAKTEVMDSNDTVDWHVSTSLEEAVLNARYHLMVDTDGKAAYKSHTTFNLLATVVPTDQDYSELVDELQTCTRVEPLAAMLKSWPEGPFKKAVIDYTTKQFNIFLKTHVNITHLSIDNYVEDISECLDIIYHKRGKSFSHLILKHEGEWIKRIYLDLDRVTSDNILASILPEIIVGDEPIPHREHASFVAQAVSVTVTDISDDVIDMATPIENYVAVIDADKFPAMQSLATSLLALGKQASESGLEINHHYLISSDNTVYEFTQGLFDCILVLKSKL